MINNYLYISKINILDKEEDYYKAYNSLSSFRKSRVDKLRFINDKKLSIIAEILLRTALKDLGINSDIEYRLNKYNKPYLKNNDNIFFNFSHSNDYVICLLSSNEVGCDIEYIKDINVDSMAKFFNKNEYSIINESNNKLDTFYRFWTLKECFMKAIGYGFNINLKDFEIIVNDNGVDINQSIDNNKYYFKEISINNYKCSLCLSNDKDLIIKYIDKLY